MDHTGLDTVEIGLHIRGKFIIGDRLELIDQQTGDALAERRGTERTVFLADVVAVHDGRNGGRIGGRTADAAFLHRADERSLGVARRGLRKVLRRLDLLALQHIALVKAGQRLAALILLIVIGALLVHGGKAGESDRVTGCAEHMIFAQDIGRDGVQDRISHLAGNKTGPNQLVELVLVERQAAADHIGLELDIGRADRLVRVLRTVLGAERARLARIERIAVLLTDERSRSRGRIVRQAERVGTHISDQTGETVALQFNTFVQLLRDAHGAAGHHIELAGSLLLQGRGGKRRRSRLALLTALDRMHGKGLTGDLVYDGHGLCLRLELALTGGVAVVTGGELTALRGAQRSLNGPVFLGHEGADLVLTVDDQTGRYALHTACGQTALDLAPEEGRELITYDAVKNTARLLGVHQIQIDIARMLDAVAHRLRGDLVEGHALIAALLEVQQILQMPGNGFTLAVRVRCEIDKVALGCRMAQLGDDLFLAFDRLIVRREIVLDIHAHFLSGEIADVTHGCLDNKIGT